MIPDKMKTRHEKDADFSDSGSHNFVLAKHEDEGKFL